MWTLVQIIVSYFGMWNFNKSVKIFVGRKQKGTRYLFVLFFVLLVNISNATVYYVSASGNDANTGTSESQAWKTLSKVSSTSFSPGDQILFKRGDEWSGTITVTSSGSAGSPIIYGAYGAGEKPKIYGSEEITGWAQHSGNIYKATFSKEITQLFIDGKRTKLARYPNSGYFDINSVQSKTIFTSDELSSDINYVGARWIGRACPWRFSFGEVSQSNSKTLALNSSPMYAIEEGEGFFLCNKLEFLDESGEWFYDNSTNTVYLWTVNGDSPANYKVKGATVENGFEIVNKKYITIQNFEILHHQGIAIYGLSGSSFLTFENNDIIDPDEYAIRINGSSSNNVVSNNVITGANADGIVNYSDNSVFSDNQISEISLLDNIGIGKLETSIGIRSRGKNVSFTHNRITNSAYIGIYFYGTDNLVQYNYVNGVCKVLDDGGGLYTYSNEYSEAGSAGSKIMYNIVLNVHGNQEGTTYAFEQGFGIYIDNRVHDVEVSNNTIAYCDAAGVYLHDNGKIDVNNNTLMDNGIGFYSVSQQDKNSITNNIVYGSNREVDIVAGNSTIHKMVYQRSATPNYDYNKYINHYNSTNIFQKDLDFSGWKSTFNQDANSNFDGASLNPGEKEELFYNDTKQSKTIDLGNSVYRDIDGNTVKDKITLEPFTSLILINTNSTSGDLNQKPVINDQTFGMSGDKKVDDFIDQVVASDPDNGQVLSYEIVGGNEEGLFYIDAVSGAIYAAKNIYTMNDNTVQLVVSVTDNSTDPLSASAIITINIAGVDPDTSTGGTLPRIISFEIPLSSSSLTVPVTFFLVDGSVTGYLLSTSSEKPTETDTRWSNSVPMTYVFNESGTQTLYAWVKDAEANISSVASATTTITLKQSSTYSEYRFEEISGARAIDSKGSNDGTILDEELRVEGIGGQGLQFTGAGYISLGQAFSDNVTDGVTISTWIKPTSTEGDYQGIVMHGGPEYDSFALYIRPSTKSIGFKTSSTTTDWTTVDAIDKLWDGEWHHVAATYNGTEKVIYLDDEILITVDAQGNIVSGVGYNLLIGAGRDLVAPTLKYEGFIDEVKVYNYGLTSSEIEDVYNSIINSRDTVYTTEEISICEGESYNGLTSAGEHRRELQSITGGDSIVITYLTVNPVYDIVENIVIQAGEDYYGWTTSGEYVRNLTTQFGCDSTVTTILSVEEKPVYTTEEVSICEGESYNGWTSAGEHRRELLSITGGDSIVTTYLTVNPVYDIVENIVIQAGEDYYGLTTSGEHVRNLTTVFGCDSTITTVLSVEEKSAHETDTVYTTEEISICEGESYNGLISTGEHRRELLSITGGDSIVTTYLTVNPVYDIVENIVIQAGEDYYGLTTSGEHVRNLTTVFGCDSTITTVLSIEEKSALEADTVYTTEEISICEGESYNGLTSAGEHRRELRSITGGDSIVTTYLTVNPVYDIVEDIIIQEGESYNDWTTAGQYVRYFTSVFGCDSTITTNLHVEEAPIVTQTIELEQGWNIFSAAVVPDDPDMEMIQYDLKESNTLFVVEDEEGRTYEKIGSTWINNIGDMKQTEGYRIRVKSACNIEITGTPVSLPMNINLKAGSNLISFPFNGSVDAMQVIQPLIDAGTLDKVQDQKGNSIEYWGAEIGWLNGIGNFNVGQGYLIEVNSDVVLTIDGVYEKSVSVNEHVETVYFQPEFQGNGSNHMNINLYGLNESNLNIGDEIAAYDGDICVGAVTLTATSLGVNAVSINASVTDQGENNGFIEDNDIELKFWDSESNEVTDFNLSLVNGELTYSMHSSVFIKLEDQLLVGENEAFSIDMYPNPAINNVNVRFSQIPESGAQLLLLDMNGKQLESRQVETTLETLDISSYPTGMYFIKTIVGDFIKTNKLIKN